MPMLMTSVKVSPVAERISPQCTARVKCSIAVSVASTSADASSTVPSGLRAV
jgi:hypothetical protein